MPGVPPYTPTEVADRVGFEMEAATQQEIIARSAVAMFDLMADVKTVKPQIKVPVRAEGDTPEDLLVHFLTELLKYYELEEFLVCDCAITRLGPKEVRATISGEPFDKARHQIRRKFKEVSFDDLLLEKTPAGTWKTRLSFEP